MRSLYPQTYTPDLESSSLKSGATEDARAQGGDGAPREERLQEVVVVDPGGVGAGGFKVSVPSVILCALVNASQWQNSDIRQQKI